MIDSFAIATIIEPLLTNPSVINYETNIRCGV